MTEKTLSAKGARCKTQIVGALGSGILFLLALGGLTSCATAPPTTSARLRLAQSIQAEPPGDYFIGRRYFRGNYRFWGYVRRPGQPWSSAVLVMLNENRQLAPDRAQLGPGTGKSYEAHAGFDDNFEYKLRGYFSGDKIFELVSDRIYPEFVLTHYELLSTNPPPIFPSQINHRSVDTKVIEKPL